MLISRERWIKETSLGFGRAQSAAFSSVTLHLGNYNDIPTAQNASRLALVLRQWAVEKGLDEFNHIITKRSSEVINRLIEDVSQLPGGEQLKNLRNDYNRARSGTVGSNILSRIAPQFGAQLISTFSQHDYVENFSKNLQGGVCLALCICWIGARGHYSAFKGMINTSVGLRIVSKLQTHDLGSAFRGNEVYYSKLFYGAGKKNLSFVGEALKTFGMSSTGEFESRPSRNTQAVADFVDSKPGFYQMHFTKTKGQGGHAIAFESSINGTLQFFDPNFGQVEFKGGQARPNFSQLLNRIMRGEYQDLNGHWIIGRFRSSQDLSTWV